MLKDKSQKAEAIFSKYFWPHAQVGETGKEMQHDEVLTQHRQSPGPVMNALMPSGQMNMTFLLCFLQLFEEATWQNTCVEGVQWHLREFLIPWSIDLQESRTVILISHCCFNSATCLLSPELWEILSMFNCDYSKDLCEKVKVNDKVIEKIRHEKYLLQN